LEEQCNDNCDQTATESYTQVTIRCTSTKSMVKLGSKSAATKAAMATVVAAALA